MHGSPPDLLGVPGRAEQRVFGECHVWTSEETTADASGNLITLTSAQNSRQAQGRLRHADAILSCD